MVDVGEVPSDLLRELWSNFDFRPNENQTKAILHVSGPLFLPAGPGSGKTRVLLWRTVNLIVTHNVPPEEIFLSTFTEKAAKQLRDGLRTFLTLASLKTGTTYDISKLYVGTIHSLCRRLLTDRRVSRTRERFPQPILLDELAQYMFIRKKRNWDRLLNSPNEGPTSNLALNEIFEGKHSSSRHTAISSLLSFFNRLSEEMINPVDFIGVVDDKNLSMLLEMYSEYLRLLIGDSGPQRTDLSLLQKVTVDHLLRNPRSSSIFTHVIIDEYQDTNRVQEELFFILSKGHGNMCIVGDDDQALYRFRGATVENFVNFPDRCEAKLERRPTKIVLSKNYRSCDQIVKFSNDFIEHTSCNWVGDRPDAFYRVFDKNIKPERECTGPQVVYSSALEPDGVSEEIASLVRKLIDSKKVDDPNQIAFLFPSLKSKQVERMRRALENEGVEVYAPRAGTFLDVVESKEIFGLIFQLFDKVTHHNVPFSDWINSSINIGKELYDSDPYIKRFIDAKREELSTAVSDFEKLSSTLNRNGWNEKDTYEPTKMKRILENTQGLSSKAEKSIDSRLFNSFAEERVKAGKPFNIRYVVTRASSVDWNFLDLFYQLCGFKHFKKYFDSAENGSDEGPICNLSLISQYISRYLDEYSGLISGNSLKKDFPKITLVAFLYVLFRREEGEYEDAEDPFPKGRVPFITIHQAKGLEFPVVVLGNPRKKAELQRIEMIIQPLIQRKGEPLDRMPLFDLMRMFYVGISRAKNLLVIPHFSGKGQWMNPPFKDLQADKTEIPDLDLRNVATSLIDDQEIPLSFSFTGDFLLYEKCPRQYMIFRKYSFVPSRSQTMFFGSLVHQTLEDLHQILIGERD